MRAIKIWNNDINKINSYVDFVTTFSVKSKERVVINISCDNVFEFYLNGISIGFGSCQNFKNDFKYYSFDITKHCKKENELLITVWHQGVDTQTYINNDAYLMFQVVEGDSIILESNKSVKCRVNNSYLNGECRKITPQLGFTFKYDLTNVNVNEFENSIEYGVSTASLNDTKNLELSNLASASVIEREDSYIIDFGKETVGYLDLDIDSDGNRNILISYGERLDDGFVPRLIEPRDFSFEITLKKGNNKYHNLFRRLAGRYFEVKKEGIKINYLGLRIVEYPLEVIEKKFSDSLIQKIYDTSIYTLKCCMHEHYEDCPWREQALYNMDSRNQMLCGYYAFHGTDFQRANLIMMSKGLLSSGLLNICFPSGVELPIPSFNLEYIIQVYEYLKYSNDYSILDIIGNSVKSVMNTFSERIDETNLIPSFEYPCWNFYEWSEENNNENEIYRTKEDKYEKSYDLIINCLYVYVSKMYDEIFNTKTDTKEMIKAIKNTFYVEKDGLYKVSDRVDRYSVLGNSFALLIGLGEKDLAEKLIKGDNLIPVTLSMCTFLYDGLLKVDKSYEKFIIEDILKKYKYMLDNGATTFWETEKGSKDFGNAGSLCHGWASMPIYYFNKLLNK